LPMDLQLRDKHWTVGNLLLHGGGILLCDGILYLAGSFLHSPVFGYVCRPERISGQGRPAGAGETRALYGGAEEDTEGNFGNHRDHCDDIGAETIDSRKSYSG